MRGLSVSEVELVAGWLHRAAKPQNRPRAAGGVVTDKTMCGRMMYVSSNIVECQMANNPNMNRVADVLVTEECEKLLA